LDNFQEAAGGGIAGRDFAAGEEVGLRSQGEVTFEDVGLVAFDAARFKQRGYVGGEDVCVGVRRPLGEGGQADYQQENVDSPRREVVHSVFV
jgi:hypothetical protein